MPSSYPPRRRRAHVGMLLILGVVLAGCAQSVARSPVDPPTGEAAEMGQLLGSLHQDRSLMSEAADVVIQDCMAQKGWTYSDTGVDVDAASPTTGAYTIDYDLTPQEAAEQGYAFYIKRLQPNPERARMLEHLRGLTKQQRQAYQEAVDGGPDAEGDYGQGIGGPTEGCLVEARRQVRGPKWQRVSVLDSELQALNHTAMQRVQSDQRLADATDAWRSCMNDAGFDVDSPEAAVDRLIPDGKPSESSRHEPSQAEIDLATADAECRGQAELHQTWTELVRRHRANVAVENPDLVGEWSDLRDTFLPNVRELLGDDTVDAVLNT